MKVLLDTCVYGGVAPTLAAAGHDFTWVGDWAQDPGDDEVLRLGAEQGRVIITIDKDYGFLAVVAGRKHTGIVRMSGLSAAQQGAAALLAITNYADELRNGAIVTVEPGRVRVRPGADNSGGPRTAPNSGE